MISLNHDDDHDRPGFRWLLVHRSLTTGELACCRCWSPRHLPLVVLVSIAGRQWAAEEKLQVGKTLTGLAEHLVRIWTSTWSVTLITFGASDSG